MKRPAFRLVSPAVVTLAVASLLASAAPARAAEPAGYEHFHTYAEMETLIDAAVADHPQIAHKLSIGQSYEGREIWAVKISDNVATDENEPEVFFNGLTHGRERLSAEMALHIIEFLTNGYATDARIAEVVDSREVWVVPMLNPDAAEFDFSAGSFRTWRKNRQPIPDSSAIGIDLNRQFGFMWNCCGGSSANPASDNYHGPEPWYAPEVRAYRDFIDGRVVDGRQQIRLSISWHSAGRMVLWPYGYTRQDVPDTMSYDDWRAMKALGQQMAALNGYRAQQGSDLYIVDGDQDDWTYHEHRIFSYTFEMAKGADKRYYPTAAEVASELANNEAPVLLMLEQADCPFRAAGLEATHCGPLNDDFEAERGWTLASTSGTGWQRSIPEASSTAAGAKQLADVPSGQSDLVTDATSDLDPNANDVDGVTTALSRRITLGPGKWTVKFRFTFAHDAAATSADYLRLGVVRGATANAIWTARGKAAERNASWTTRTLSLTAYAGQTIQLKFTAADGAADNLVEAAVDNVRVYQKP